MIGEGKQNREGTPGSRLQRSAFRRHTLGVIVAVVGLSSLLIGGVMIYKYGASYADPTAFVSGEQERLMSIGIVFAVFGVPVVVVGSRMLGASNVFCVVLVLLLILLVVAAPYAVPLPLYRVL